MLRYDSDSYLGALGYRLVTDPAQELVGWTDMPSRFVAWWIVGWDAQ